MSNDHYVSRTYLKQWIDPNKPGYLNVYRKEFPKKSKLKTPAQICYEPNGDSNPYFPNNTRILDIFLNNIERRWELSLSELEKGTSSLTTKLHISLYIAYLRSCTPTAKRLGKSLLGNNLNDLRPGLAEYVKKKMEDCEDNRKLVEGLLSPEIILEIDSEYSHAIAIKNLLELGIKYSEQTWLIYVPLTPKLSILIFCNPKCKNQPSLVKSVDNEVVVKLNIDLIKSAEKSIISNVSADWISVLIEENKNWKMDIVSEKVNPIPTHESIYIMSQRIVEKTD